MKKLIALAAAGVLAFSTTVFAAESPTAAAVAAKTETVTAVETAAASANMSVGEYLNNAVVNTPGVPDAMPVGQGGKIIINGVHSNATLTLRKVSTAIAGSAKTQASTLGGTLLNVVDTMGLGFHFTTANVNFYLKGLEDGQKVVVYQYVKGEWVELNVTEVRADHVVVDMTAAGPLAFILVP